MQQCRRVQREPGIDATYLHTSGGKLDELLRTRVQSACLLVNKQRDGHAPGTLARDAPVGSILDHSRDALFAPCRGPLNLLDVAQCMSAKLVLFHADEPLRSRAEDQRCLVTPAMGIAVAIGLVMSQPATLLQHFDDREDGLFHFQTSKQRSVG